MDNVREVDFTSERCYFCGKPATRLCDFITHSGRWVGHPPKINGVIPENEPMEFKATCDRPICDKCSIHVNESFDICPKHYEEIKKAGGNR